MGGEGRDVNRVDSSVAMETTVCVCNEAHVRTYIPDL